MGAEENEGRLARRGQVLVEDFRWIHRRFEGGRVVVVRVGRADRAGEGNKANVWVEYLYPYMSNRLTRIIQDKHLGQASS